MRQDLLKSWAILFGLQALLAFVILRDFLTGERYFAYLDIAADTYAQYSAHAMMMARMLLQGEGWSDWSFQIGLGAPNWMLGDAFSLLSLLGGPEHVLELRIWVYILKLTLGGTFFLLLARPWVARREAAVLAALAYAFCGFVISNGQWDGEANAFVAFPLMLWAIARHLRTGSLVSVPLGVAAGLLTGVFFLTVAVSLIVACAAFVAMSNRPGTMLRAWLTRIVPLAALGYLIAAPFVLPYALRLLDSPRLSGATALFTELSAQAFTTSSLPLLLVQLGGLFHKDLFGIGNAHSGYLNYLEGPEFYIGMLPLLLISQLWRGSALDRRVLVLGLVGIAAYFVFPVFRLSAFGFAAPYFRSTTLWATLALALLAARAVDQVLERGIDPWLLALGATFVGGLLGLVAWGSDALVWVPHVVRIVILAGCAVALLALSCARLVSAAGLPHFMLAFVAIEIVLIAWPSYFLDRFMTSPTVQPFKDRTRGALASIRQRDDSIFRVEKTYTSVHTSDAMGQNYMGVRSYYYHGSAIVDFHTSMDLTMEHPQGRPPNWSNWLPDPGERYLLHSLLGVKYLIATEPVPAWPGFTRVLTGRGYTVYQNDYALPLGIVQSQQITRSQIAALSSLPLLQSRWFKDAALINAVVVDGPLPEWGRPFDLESLVKNWPLDVTTSYVAPVLALQRSGLRLTHFSSNRVVGRIQPEEKGILVFSIPFYDGWRLRIDGQPTTLMKANFGMLAAPVTAGAHEVELTYQLPGRQAGALLGFTGITLLVLLRLRAARAGRSPARREPGL